MPGPYPDNEVARRAIIAKEDADVLLKIAEEFPRVKYGKLPDGRAVLVNDDYKFRDIVDRVHIVRGEDDLYLVASVHRWGHEVYYADFNKFGPGFRWVSPQTNEVISAKLLTLWHEYMNRM